MNVRIGRLVAIGVLGALSAALSGAPVHGQGKAEGDQTVLGPGLYVFQTRTKSSTCGDAERDGFVLSYMGAIDGVPGSRKMTMQIVNSKYFTDWTLTVTETNEVVGESRMGTSPDAPESYFAVSPDKDRFKGTGFRSYNGTLNGKKQRCRVNYDALLRRIDRIDI